VEKGALVIFHPNSKWAWEEKIQARNVRFAGEIDIGWALMFAGARKSFFFTCKAAYTWKNLLEIWFRKYACKMF
jgi:hypothetical protein